MTWLILLAHQNEKHIALLSSTTPCFIHLTKCPRLSGFHSGKIEGEKKAKEGTKAGFVRVNKARCAEEEWCNGFSLLMNLHWSPHCLHLCVCEFWKSENELCCYHDNREKLLIVCLMPIYVYIPYRSLHICDKCDHKVSYLGSQTRFEYFQEYYGISQARDNNIHEKRLIINFINSISSIAGTLYVTIEFLNIGDTIVMDVRT